MKKLHALFVWSLWLGLLPAAVLHAQQPSGNVGRSLENSLQVGSGGMNSPIAQPDYRSRNDIITGNVSGLGYFHGNVGYSAPGEFHGSSADDRLFRFNAQSYPTNTAGTPPGYGAQGAYAPGQPQGVYRSSAATSAGDIYQATGTGVLFVRPNDVGYRPDVKDVAGYSLYNDMSLNARPYVAGTTNLGQTQQQMGNSLQLQATPLLGVRQADPSNLPAVLGTTDRVVRPPNPLRPGEPQPPAFNADHPSSAIDGQVQGQTNAYSSWDPSQANSGMNNTRDDRFPADATRSPAMELGRQIQGRVDSSRTDRTMTLDQRVAQIQARMFSPIGNRSVPAGQDAYFDLLTQIQNQQRIAAGQTPSSTNAQPNVTPGGSVLSVPLTPGAVNFATGLDDNLSVDPTAAAKKAPLILPSPEQLKQAQAARQAELVARGFASPAAPAEPAPNTAGANHQAKIGDKSLPANATSETANAAPPTKANAALAASEDKLQTLLRSIDYRAKPLATLAPKSDDGVANLMRQAEEAMVAGRYFTADERYRAVLAAAPNTPLAKVGLVHAQLGAGLTRSAAFALRQLLETHPELIAMQYDARLLPSPQRLEALQKEIDNLIANSQRSEPAILLAYLGYQFQMKPLTEYGLNIAQTRDATDPLVTLLRRIWLHESPPVATPK